MRKDYISWLRQSALKYNVDEEYYQYAWEIAKKAAKLLREKYNVTRVRVFGSLTHKNSFHKGSDVDLAVEGLEDSDYWEALTSVLFLDDQVFVEIGDQETCPKELWKVIEQEGIDV